MARMRSPNFPAIPLDAAVSAAKEIYDKNRKAVIMREDAAKDIGYSGLTGRSMQVLGALVQYDLMENTSKGECRITKIAEDILYGYPDEVKHTALKTAGQAPTLFGAVYDRFDGEIPGENAVRSFLIQNGFTNDGAEKALKNFLTTNRYLESSGISDSFSQSDENGGSSEASNNRNNDETSAPPQSIIDTVKSAQENGVVKAWAKGVLDFSLTSAGLSVTGSTNSAKDLRNFVKKLENLAALLPEEADRE